VPPAPKPEGSGTPEPASRPTVTYKGAEDPSDGTTHIAIQRGGTHPDEEFSIDVPVETSNTTAKRLADLAGHKFNIKGG